MLLNLISDVSDPGRAWARSGLEPFSQGRAKDRARRAPRNNENVEKELICICDLIFLLKIFQSNANFLKENHIPRAL